MRIKATLRWTAVLGFVLVAAGPATAQVNGAPADGQASGTAAGGSSAPNTLSFEDLAKMSLPDLKKLGASLYSRILGNQATLQFPVKKALARVPGPQGTVTIKHRQRGFEAEHRGNKFGRPGSWLGNHECGDPFDRSIWLS